MKNENGITSLALIIVITIMSIIGLTVFYTADGIDTKVEEDALKAELDIVHHIVLQEWNKKLTLDDEYDFKGVPIINSNDATDEIGPEQDKLNQNVETSKRITFIRKTKKGEERYYQYYKLTPSHLKSLGAKNVSSDYLICYETGEVANITKYQIGDENPEPLYTK